MIGPLWLARLLVPGAPGLRVGGYAGFGVAVQWHGAAGTRPNPYATRSCVNLLPGFIGTWKMAPGPTSCS